MVPSRISDVVTAPAAMSSAVTVSGAILAVVTELVASSDVPTAPAAISSAVSVSSVITPARPPVTAPAARSAVAIVPSRILAEVTEESARSAVWIPVPAKVKSWILRLVTPPSVRSTVPTDPFASLLEMTAPLARSAVPTV